MLSTNERAFYQRQMLLPNWGEEGQLVLKKSKVLVVGAGGLGCPAIVYLAGAGVGQIGIVDPDTVSISNLHRQVLYTYDQIGESKAHLAEERAKQINPFIEVVAYHEALTAANALERVKGFDIVLDCTDNFMARYLINDACVIAEKPWVFGAIHRYEAQLAIFNGKLPTGARGATYRCMFPNPPSQGTIPNCSEAGVMGALPGIVGAYQASEAVKYLLGHGKPLAEHILVWDVATMLSQKIKLKRTAAANVTSITPTTLECDVPMKKSITARELASLLGSNNRVHILDVREVWEFEVCRLENAMLHPFSILQKSLPALPLQKADVVVYCHHGIRSRHAIGILQPLFPHLQFYNLEGGIATWAHEVDETMERY